MRKRMNKRVDRRVFKRTVNKTKRINLFNTFMRGGIRL